MNVPSSTPDRVRGHYSGEDTRIIDIHLVSAAPPARPTARGQRTAHATPIKSLTTACGVDSVCSAARDEQKDRGAENDRDTRSSRR